MKRLRITVLAASIAVLGMFAAPAQASHTCGLDDVPIAGPVCDGYHDPKLVVQYLVFCVTSETHCV
ncbi:MAG: hypothetical protein ACRDI3_05795 [Actinomycetota bacterium]